MPAILDALGPVFLVILLGVGLVRVGFPGEGFWPLAERFTYFVLFPALLVQKLATASFGGMPFGAIGLTVAALLGVVTAALLAAAPYISRNGPEFTSVYQGAIRFNTYVGLAAAVQLHGSEGLTAAAVAIAFLIPLVNVLCVAVFALKVGRAGRRVRTALLQIARNPLVVACAAGIGLNLTGVGLPGWSGSVLTILGQAALPLGLLAVGAGLRLEALRSGTRALAVSTAFKLVVMPGLAAVIGLFFGLTGTALHVVCLFAGLPTASSAYILARELGGDAPLMASLVSAQTLIAMVVLPLTMGWLVRL